MAKLTDSEQQELNQARTDLFDGVNFDEFDKEVMANAVFRAAFESGLSYNQAKLDKLASMLIAAGVSEGIIKSVLQESEILRR